MPQSPLLAPASATSSWPFLDAALACQEINNTVRVRRMPSALGLRGCSGRIVGSRTCGPYSIKVFRRRSSETYHVRSVYAVARLGAQVVGYRPTWLEQ